MNIYFINGNQVSENYFERKVILNNFIIYKVSTNILGLKNYYYKNYETGEEALEVER